MRHEKMTEILDSIKEVSNYYVEGLCLDIECLNKIADLVMSNYEAFACCDICKQTKAYDDMTRSGIVIEHTWRPLCKACKAKHAKKFLCVWGAGYPVSEDGNAIQETHHEDYFCQENGYDNRDIIAIQNMELGMSHNLIGVTDIHSVVRIK